MLLVVILVLLVAGLGLGSFVNALVWRLHEQREARKASKQLPSVTEPNLSIVHGRSICPNCHHELAAADLVPVLSWLLLRGKCRYCHNPISWQYPVVELASAGLFVISYIAYQFDSDPKTSVVLLIFWLAFLVGFLALIVYDLRWMELPNRIVYPLLILAAVLAVWRLISADHILQEVINQGTAALIGGGLFYVLFQLSKGRWIGGGDVKLGFLLGLVVGTPARSLLILFLASVLGTVVALPLMLHRRLNRRSLIPFGPFLIIATIIVQLFGANILHWYSHFLVLSP